MIYLKIHAIPSQLIKSLSLIFSLLTIWLNCAHAHQRDKQTIEPFEIFAQEIINGLNNALLNDLTTRSGYGRPSIKFSKFQNTNKGTNEALSNLANEYNARLLAALIKKSEGRFKFIAPINTPKNGQNFALCGATNDCPNLKKKTNYHPEADILITGSLRIHDQKGFLTYRATGLENGLILAATSRIKIALPKRYQKRYSFPKFVLPEDYRSSVFIDQSDHRCINISYFQQALDHLGYRPGPITGKISSATRRAIRAYQWHHNLPETGILNCSLFKHLKAQLTSDYVW